MSSALSLGLILVSVLFFIFFIVASIINYKARFNMKYHLTNTFPYELNYKGSFADNISGNISLLLCAIALIAFFVTFDSSHNNGFLIYVLIGGIFEVIFTVVLVFLPLTHLKSHLLTVVLLMTFTFTVNGASAIASYQSFKEVDKPQYLAAMIIALVLCLFIFILVLNPKMKNWANLSPVPNKDGTTSYARPKFFVLAFTEWMLIITVILSTIPIICMVFKV